MVLFTTYIVAYSPARPYLFTFSDQKDTDAAFQFQISHQSHAVSIVHRFSFAFRSLQSFGSNSCLTCPNLYFPSTNSMTMRSSTCTRRPRPSVASHLRDPDEPIIISTNLPKKARPAEPPISLRMTTTSPYDTTSSTIPPCTTTFTSSSTTSPTPRPLFGFVVKLNGEQVPFLIPRPSLPFRLPEAKP